LNYRLSYNIPSLRNRQVRFGNDHPSMLLLAEEMRKQGGRDFKLEELTWTDITPSAWKEQDAAKS
jgi:hypothetical protein